MSRIDRIVDDLCERTEEWLHTISERDYYRRRAAMLRRAECQSALFDVSLEDRLEDEITF